MLNLKYRFLLGGRILQHLNLSDLIEQLFDRLLARTRLLELFLRLLVHHLVRLFDLLDQRGFIRKLRVNNNSGMPVRSKALSSFHRGTWPT